MSCIALVIAIALSLGPKSLHSAPVVSAISGHGGITAGLDQSGALSVLRWPGPGGPDQLRQALSKGDSSSTTSIGGGRWGMQVNGRWFWLGDPVARTRQGCTAPGSAVVETTVDWVEARLSVRQRAGVLPGSDVFVSAIEIGGAASAPRVVWIADFAPATRQIAEIPASDKVLDALNGFAAFADREAGRLWSFRPKKPGRDEWARARSLVEDHAGPGAWSAFADGAWIGVAAGARVSNLAAASSSRELLGAIEGGATMPAAVVGPSSVAIEPTVEIVGSGYRAWIALAIGPDIETGSKSLDETAGQAATFFDAVPGPAAPPAAIASFDTGGRARAMQHWATLLTLRDPKSGFTVRGLSVEPPLARDWPRVGALVAWAFFEAGEHEAAEKSIEAYLGLVRTDDRPRKPFGSMPESVYTNGELASPHFVVDDRGPARTLWVADRIVRARGSEARSAWVQRYWNAIEAAAEFLSTWADSRRGAPLYSDDPVGLGDAETQDRLFAAYAGMSAAIRLAEYAGRDVPESWRVRRGQLQALTEWILKEPGKWVPGVSLLLETEGISESVLGQLAKECSRQIGSQPGLDGEKLARLILQSAILQGAKSNAEGLEAALGRIAGEGVGTPNSPDALISAEILLALRLSNGK